ncbi:hypothetical protein [Chitinimonas naiadis]
MTRLKQGLLIALIQTLLVGSVGAKFLIDRETYPHVWIKTLPYDPDLPIRGRYVRLSLTLEQDNQSQPGHDYDDKRIRLGIRNNALVAIPDEAGHQQIRETRCGTQRCWILAEPVAYFIPEHAVDPSIRAPNEELWVEATIPPNGPPRPIRLGVKVDGKLMPLDVQ